MDKLEYRVNGYAWSLIPPFWRPVTLSDAQKQFASLYFELHMDVAIEKFDRFMARDDQHMIAMFYQFEQGIEDSGRIYIDDDAGNFTLDVAEIIRATGFNRSYITREIREGRLYAQRLGREYRIFIDDYVKWYQSPLRGKKSG